MEKCIGCELCAGVCPANCIYVRGADNDPDEPDLARRALRLRLRDQLPPLHPLRPVRRGVPDRGDHRVEAVRVLVHQPPGRHLHQGRTASSTTRASRSSCRGKTGATATTSTPRVGCGPPHRPATPPSRARSAGAASSATASERPSRRKPSETCLSESARAMTTRPSSNTSSSSPRPDDARRRHRRDPAPQPVHAALGLVLTLFGVAVQFVAQEAHFLAAVQVIVYAGAIVVLFLFVIMLLGVDRADRPRRSSRSRSNAARRGDGRRPGRPGQRCDRQAGDAVDRQSGVGSTAGHGETIDRTTPTSSSSAANLYTDHVLAFQLTSVLLIVAVVGTVLLTRKWPKQGAAT